MPTALRSHSVTLADIARVAGVTKTTVSFALNGNAGVSDQTRQSILETARKLGYVPNPHARNLSNGRADNTIGLFTLRFDLGVGARKVQLIQSALNERGYDVPVQGVGIAEVDDEAAQTAAIAAIRRHKSRGLVCLTLGLQPRALRELQRYQEEGGVLISFDYAVDLESDQVVFDRADNTYQGARHLIDLGHRDLCYADYNRLSNNALRVNGFRRALEEAELSVRPEWMLEANNARDYAQAGQLLAHQFLRMPARPSGVCILNDVTALAFIAELERAGVKCPDDVSVVGHDDHPLSRFAHVPLSTVTHPAQTIAGKVIELLLSRLEGFDGPPRKITVRGELIARQSSAAPR